MDVHKMLEQVKAGQLDIAEAEAKLKDLPYEDLGYAKLDHHRKLRSGFGETIFCQGKPDPYLKEIFLKFYERDGEVVRADLRMQKCRNAECRMGRPWAERPFGPSFQKERE